MIKRFKNNLTDKQKEYLQTALDNLSRLEKANKTGFNQGCSCYRSITDDWDEKTAKEISDNVRLYLSTWVTSYLKKAFVNNKKQDYE